MKKHTERIEIHATRVRREKGYYDINIFKFPESHIVQSKKDKSIRITLEEDTFYKIPKKTMRIHGIPGNLVLSESGDTSKAAILCFVKEANKIIPTSVKLDENEFTEESAWTTDWSDKLVIKVYRPAGLQIMGSTCVSLKDSFLLPKVKDTIKTPRSYGEGFNDRYVTFEKYTNKYFDNVKDIVPVLFDALDILGAEVEVDGKKLSASEAKKTHLWDVKIVEIYINC